MRKIYLQLLKVFLCKEFRRAQKEKGLTQAEMAEILEIDIRTYSNISRGKSICSTLTFVLFLLYCCDDPRKLLEDFREVLD